MKIFLDDIRDPKDCAKYMHRRIGAFNPLYLEDWVIARNYDEFINIIQTYYEIITHISYDHDLADGHYTGEMYKSLDEYYESIKSVKEKTGLDCAKFMKSFYDDINLSYPTMFVHSMNPVGTEAIINLFVGKYE